MWPYIFKYLDHQSEDCVLVANIRRSTSTFIYQKYNLWLFLYFNTWNMYDKFLFMSRGTFLHSPLLISEFSNFKPLYQQWQTKRGRKLWPFLRIHLLNSSRRSEPKQNLKNPNWFPLRRFSSKGKIKIASKKPGSCLTEYIKVWWKTLILVHLLWQVHV